jgi:hypothetical protein
MFLQLEIKPTFQLKLFQESIEVYSNQNKNLLLNLLFKSMVIITFQLLTKLLSQSLLIKLPIFQYTKLQILLIFLKLLIQQKKDQSILSKLEIKLTFLLMSFQEFIVHFSNQLKNHHHQSSQLMMVTIFQLAVIKQNQLQLEIKLTFLLNLLQNILLDLKHLFNLPKKDLSTLLKLDLILTFHLVLFQKYIQPLLDMSKNQLQSLKSMMNYLFLMIIKLFKK